MPSLIDAHFDLADIEAQLSSTTFKLDAFFEDEPEDEDHMIVQANTSHSISSDFSETRFSDF